MVRVTIQWEAMKMLTCSIIKCHPNTTLNMFRRQTLNTFWQAWRKEKDPQIPQHGSAKYVTVSVNGEQIDTDKKLQQLFLQTNPILNVQFLHPRNSLSSFIVRSVSRFFSSDFAATSRANHSRKLT